MAKQEKGKLDRAGSGARDIPTEKGLVRKNGNKAENPEQGPQSLNSVGSGLEDARRKDY